jgi:hypothetical protein
MWWSLNNAQTKTRPAHVYCSVLALHALSLMLLQVMDVAQALANILTMPSVKGTYNLPGPSELTHEYLLDLVSTITYRKASSAPMIPKAVALFLTRLSQKAIWWPTLSPDEVERRYIDDVDVPGDWATFGVDPTEIEPVAISYLRRYRSASVLSTQHLRLLTDNAWRFAARITRAQSSSPPSGGTWSRRSRTPRWVCRSPRRIHDILEYIGTWPIGVTEHREETSDTVSGLRTLITG